MYGVEGLLQVIVRALVEAPVVRTIRGSEHIELSVELRDQMLLELAAFAPEKTRAAAAR